MIKLVFGPKNKIIKFQNGTFESLRQIIKISFPQAPVDYSLSYIDEDKDQICLNSEQDLNNMLSAKLRTYKVYIKESLTQTIVIDLDRSSQIESSLDNINPVGEQNKPEEKTRLPFFLKVETKKGKEENLESQTVLSKEKEEEREMQKTESKQAQLKEQIKVQNNFENILLQKQQIFQVKVKPNASKKIVKLQIPKEALVKSKVEVVKKQENIKKNNLQVEKLFEQVQEIRNIKKQQQIIHLHGVICVNCKDQFGIIGIRYQCILCNHYNLCSKCEVYVEHQHALLKIKTPKHTISQEAIIQKYRKEIYQPVQQKVIPPGHYIPSINKEDAMRIIEYAKQAYENGYNRAKQSIEELFEKIQKLHQNPYQVMKPIEQKPQSPVQNSQYLSQLMGIPFNQAFRFVNKYPALNKQKLVQLYLQKKK